MWVMQFASWANIHAKQFHVCDSSEMATKYEIELGQAIIYANDIKRSKKSRKWYSHKQKHKKRQKCSTRNGNWAYPKTVELNVSTTPRCDVGCQSCKDDVRNELCSIRLMSFDNIEVVMRLPRI